MKASKVLARYAAGEKNFQRKNLRGQSFRGEKLPGADFSKADLRGADFTEANLQQANFTDAKCGLQKRWAIFLTILSWLLAAISGYLTIYAGAFISLIIGTSNLDNRIVGWVSLIVLVILLIVTIRRGITAAAVAAAIAVGVAAGTIVLAAAIAAGVAAGTAGTAAAAIAAIAGTIAIAVAGAIAAVVGITIAGTIAVVGATGTAAGTSAVAVAVVVAVTVIGISVYINWRAIKGDQRDAWLRSLAIAIAATGGTNFRGADLTEANFTEAKLKSTDFRKAILTLTSWRDAQRIDFVRPGKTYLNSASLRHLLITGVGQDKNYDRQDLSRVNLSNTNLENASFIDTDFYYSNLQEANLSKALLMRANFERADLRNADLTGCCIQDWVINESTKLDGVICDYVYLKWVDGDKRDQMPPRGEFKPGGFVTFVRYILETVELYHEKDINPRLALNVLQKMSKEYNEPLDIVALGKKGERVFLQVKVSENIIRENFKDNYYSRYDTDLKLWSGNIHHLPPAVDSFIEKRISEIASEKTDDFVFVDAIYTEGNYIENVQGDYIKQQGNFGIGHMSGGEIKGNAKIAGVINEAEQKNITETAQEIQRLLENLSRTNPPTTSREKNMVVGEAVDQIENNPTLKAKVINIINAGTIEAFKEAIDHPLANILVATIEGWQDT